VAEAKYLDARLSLVSLISVVGDVIGKGGKLAKRLGGEAAQRVLQALQRVDIVKFPGLVQDPPQARAVRGADPGSRRAVDR
jgi:hypothetical protein